MLLFRDDIVRGMMRVKAKFDVLTVESAAPVETTELVVGLEVMLVAAKVVLVGGEENVVGADEAGFVADLASWNLAALKLSRILLLSLLCLKMGA